MPSKLSWKKKWSGHKLRGLSGFHHKLLLYVGGRLCFVRQYATADGNGITGKIPQSLNEDVFDLYLFYLEISFLLVIPTGSKGKYVMGNLADAKLNLKGKVKRGVVSNLIGILLDGDFKKLGDVKGAINSALSDSNTSNDNRQHFTEILAYMRDMREGRLSSDRPTMAFVELWRLVEVCQQSSDEYPLLIDSLFRYSETIVAKLTRGQEQAKRWADMEAELAKTGEPLRDDNKKRKVKFQQWYACVQFFATLFANTDIQTSMRAYNNLQGLLGHLYRSHLFYLPPEILDCDPFYGQKTVTLEQAAAVVGDLKELSAAVAKGYTSGSKCRVMPDLAYIIEKHPNKVTVKQYLKDLAKQHNNREIYFLGWRAANWRLSKFVLNCSRAALTIAQGGGPRKGADIITGLYRVGRNSQIKQEDSIAEANAVDKVIQNALKDDPLSFAQWALLATLPDDVKTTTRDAVGKIKARRGAFSERTRAYRNLHDLSKSLKWPDIDKRDSPESYPTRLGQALNRRKFGARWKGFVRLVKVAVNRELNDDAQLETLLRVSQGAKDYLLMYFVPLSAFVSRGVGKRAKDEEERDVDEIPLDIAQGLMSRSATNSIKELIKIFAGDAKLRDAARQLVSLYPSYLDYFLAGKVEDKDGDEAIDKEDVGGSGEEAGEVFKERKEIITPSRLASAVFKALAMKYEDRLSSVSEKGDAKTYRDLISKCARVIFIHEYVVANSRVELQRRSDGTKKIVATPFRQALDAAWLPKDGLSFLALSPAILPRSKLITQLADLGQTLLNEPFVVNNAFVGPAPAAEIHANPSFFKREHRDLRDVIISAIQVLSILRISAKTKEDLPQLLFDFVGSAEKWWDYHVQRVQYEWDKAEGNLEDNAKEPERPKSVISPLNLINPSDFLDDSEKIRVKKVKKTTPLSLTTGPESIGNIASGTIKSLASWTRIISDNEEDPTTDVIRFTLRGSAFQYADIFQKKYGILVSEENFFKIKGDNHGINPAHSITGREQQVAKKNAMLGNLPGWIGKLRAKINDFEEKREDARVLDYQLAVQLEMLDSLISRRKIVTAYLVERNCLKRKREDFFNEGGDLAAINKRLTDAGWSPLASLDTGSQEQSDVAEVSKQSSIAGDTQVASGVDEVNGIRAIWEEINTLLVAKQDSRVRINEKVSISSLDPFLDRIFDRPRQAVDLEYANLKKFSVEHKIDEVSLPEVALKEYIKDILYRQVDLERAIAGKVAAVITGRGEENACKDFLTNNQQELEALPLGIILAELQSVFPAPYDLIITLRKILHDFFDDIRVIITNMYVELDALELERTHIEGSGKKSSKKSKYLFVERVRAWDILSTDRYFPTFIEMEDFPCYLRLPKSILTKLRTENGGAGIVAILLLPPRLPHRHVIANVTIRGPKNTVLPVPLFVKKLAEWSKKGGAKPYVIGVDNNRLHCRRMFAFCGVDKDKKLVRFEKEKPPTEKEYAALVGTYNYKQDRPNDCKGVNKIKIEFWDEKGLTFNDIDVERKFASAFQVKFLPDKRTYLIPHDDTPFKVRSVSREWTFSDYLAAPAFYWADARPSLGRVIRGCMAKRKKIDEDSNGRPTQSEQLIRNRLKTEIYCTRMRVGHLRTTAIDYWIRALCYMILRFDPSGLAYERLRFNPWGKEGGLGLIIESMVKDFKTAIMKVKTWLDQADITFRCGEQIRSVKARGTSQECDNDAGDTGPVDRRSSSDWIWCFLNQRVVDAHITSAGMIGRRHPLFEEKASVKLVRMADSKDVQQQLTEFRYKRAVQEFLPWYLSDRRF